MTMETQFAPASVPVPDPTPIPEPATAPGAEAFWVRMDRYGGYAFWTLFLAVGAGAPLAAFVYTLLDHTVLE